MSSYTLRDFRRIHTNHRCVALDLNAKRCGRRATWGGCYHGDNDLYGGLAIPPPVGWVAIEMCEQHMAATHPYERIGKRYDVKGNRSDAE